MQKNEISDERIEVIHKDNGGVSSARNAGLDAVKEAFSEKKMDAIKAREDIIE